MFDFMYIRSSHEKLLYQMLFDIENRCSAKQMVTFSISKELGITLKYYYKKNIRVVSRSHVEKMFVF